MKVAVRPWTAPDGRSGTNYCFWCPGCDAVHAPNHTWAYNGDTERPTFQPSVLVTYHDGRTCHSFVTDGRIQFLGDCYHELAGQTVDLPDVPEWLVKETLERNS